MTSEVIGHPFTEFIVLTDKRVIGTVGLAQSGFGISFSCSDSANAALRDTLQYRGRKNLLLLIKVFSNALYDQGAALFNLVGLLAWVLF